MNVNEKYAPRAEIVLDEFPESLKLAFFASFNDLINTWHYEKLHKYQRIFK